jgi:hypothetical protein
MALSRPSTDPGIVWSKTHEGPSETVKVGTKYNDFAMADENGHEPDSARDDRLCFGRASQFDWEVQPPVDRSESASISRF